MELLFYALALLVSSGLLALFFVNKPSWGVTLACAGVVVASVIAAIPAFQVLGGLSFSDWCLAINAAPFKKLWMGLDPLSSFFLIPTLLLSALASIYGRSYLLAYQGRKRILVLALFWNLLIAFLILVLIARDALIFLVAWEAMTLASYVLVSWHHQKEEVRRAGKIFLIVSHISLACLIATFLLLEGFSGELTFSSFLASVSAPTGAVSLYAVIFLMALVGFGIKAGLVPLHVWLPETHAVAPSQMSALMSGVLVKMGIYGLLRITTFLPRASFWGPLLIVIGLLGAFWGISFALFQRDLKRILAYSSIENVGIIVLGLGIGFLGANQGNAVVAVLGAAGGLLHLWNHVLMKGLLFLCAGSILHSTGTKDLEQLGGLMKRMPRTSLPMVVGAVAIAGLPPLNGFISEWLIYLGVFQQGLAKGAGGIALLLVSGMLALMGGLAALCFVRMLGVALLGEGRSQAAIQAQESSLAWTMPLWILATLCVGIALFPQIVISVLGSVFTQIYGSSWEESLISVQRSLQILGVFHAAIWFALGAGWWIWTRLRHKHRDSPASQPVETWGCAYAAPSTRMQYTARSFAQFIAYLLPKFLRPPIHLKKPDTLFPSLGNLAGECSDPFTRTVYEPFFARWADRFSRLRWLQRGAVHMYILYIFIGLVIGLAWASLGFSLWDYK